MKTASIIPFKCGGSFRGHVLSGNPGAIKVEIPAYLAQRISEAAIWVPKSPEQLALDTLREAFPDMTGVA